MTGAVIVFCTCPNETVAVELSRVLVQERLAACVSRLPGIRSMYRWEAAVQDEPEVLLLVKTMAESLPELEMRLRSLHPYEVPEIIAVPVAAGSAPYLAWLAGSVGPRASSGGSTK